MPTTSRVIIEQGAPCLYINGTRHEGLAYMTYLTERNRYADFAAAGYRLYSMPVFFGHNHLNENSGLDVFTKGIFDDPDRPDFSVFEADIRRILDACPDAYILPRVNVSLSRAWELTHPDELCDPYPDGTLGRASFASDAWAEEIKRELTVFIDRVRNSDYAPHIAGYQIAGGNTEEWLPLDKRGISGRRAEEKYAAYLGEHDLSPSDTAYYRFYSDLTASRIRELAAHVKGLTHRAVVVGSFYGYTLECPDRTFGHHALGKLLECEDIDFLCSPVSYSATRAPGRDHPYMTPFASIAHHGKLYFSENDTRTHLSRPVNDTAWYNTPIWFGPDRETSLAVIKLHAARALVHRHAAWWFDMWGGWFADEAYMKLMERLRALFAESRDLPMDSEAEVAVFVDEEAYALLPDGGTAAPVCSGIREALGKMSAPYDLYLSSDAEAVLKRYKAVISLIPIPTPHSERVADLAQAHGIPHLPITPENAAITPAELRSFLQSARVHIWCDTDAVVYANRSYLFLHTTVDTPCTLIPPDNRPLREIFSGESLTHALPTGAGRSYLFFRAPEE